MSRIIKIVIFSLFFLTSALYGQDQERPEITKNEVYFNAELALSPINNITRYKALYYSTDFILKGGYRFQRWGVFGQLEYNGWPAYLGDDELLQMAFNIGLGGEVLYFGGRARTSFAFGLAIKGNDISFSSSNSPSTQENDEAGKMGFFTDFRPAGFRFSFDNSNIKVGFDPLAVNLEAPVLDTIPLVVIEYRTVLIIEYGGI